MKKFKTAFLKWGSAAASLALVLGVASSKSVCMFWFHQPKLPDRMRNQEL